MADPIQNLERRKAIFDACVAILLKARILRTGGARGILKATLDTLVWKYTEASPLKGTKYTSCKWWTKGALTAYRKDPRGYIKLVNLDHVVTRKSLVAALLEAKTQKQIKAILETIEACVVLRTEHAKISKTKSKPLALTKRNIWAHYGRIERVLGPNAR